MKVKPLSRVQLLVNPWTAAYQAPLSMAFSRQEYWSGVPVPSLGGIARLNISICNFDRYLQIAVYMFYYFELTSKIYEEPIFPVFRVFFPLSWIFTNTIGENCFLSVTVLSISLNISGVNCFF